MNTGTATIERRDPRARPHTPWPLVQPLARLVPIPTSNPAIASRGHPVVSSPAAASAWPDRVAPSPATTSPLTKAIRQSRPGPRTAVRTIPLIPAINPWYSHSSPATSPISAPPATAPGMAAAKVGAIVRTSPRPKPRSRFHPARYWPRLRRRRAGSNQRHRRGSSERRRRTRSVPAPWVKSRWLRR